MASCLCQRAFVQSVSRLLTVKVRFFIYIQIFCSIYFNGIEWMSCENQADASESSGEEVLHRTDRLRLFGHFDFLLC